MNTIKQLFIQFLQDNNIYEQFINNLYYTSSLEDFIDCATINNSARFITKAFNWGKTKEGSYFWVKVSIKWKKTLFKHLLPQLIKIIKKNNLYGYFIINTFKNGKRIKGDAETLMPYDYLYEFFKDTNLLNTSDYKKMQEEWLTITLKKII